MRTLVLALTTVALIGCEAPPAAKVQQALQAYVRCMHSAARALDDHRSEASAIAAAVASKCSGERPVTATTLSDLPQEITMATTVVLDERNRNAK
ncbi:MAG TPA: hypothetical protein VHT03_10560 [Rhizomicrobium sp.]|nr:hypothetical protein [Rhizomicrobium sp.]